MMSWKLREALKREPIRGSPFSLQNIFFFWRYPDLTKRYSGVKKKTYFIVPEGLPLMLKKQNSKNILT